MPSLFDRACIVTIGSLQTTGLRYVFRVEKSLAKDPNSLDLQIYNLSAESRAKVQAKGATCTLIAGYASQSEVIFSGDVTAVSHSHQGPDWVTHVQSGDGQNAFRSTRMSVSLGAGTTFAQAFEAVASRMGVSARAAIDEVKATGNLRSAYDKFVNGITLSGQTSDVLDKLCRAGGYEYSIQDGNLQVVPVGETAGTEVVLLSATSGMIGSPDIGDKGQIKVRSLIQPRLLPGRLLRLNSLTLKGDYRIEKTVYTGDSFGQEWYADLEMRALT